VILNATTDMSEALAPVANVLKRLGVRFYVGGSVASSFRGAARATMDVDIVCEMNPVDAEPFVQDLGEGFYVSLPAIRSAIEHKSCFNVIKLSSGFKVDVFVSRQRIFDLNCMSRATTEILSPDVLLKVPIATAEDMILIKLEWYKLSDQTSERQWNDVRRLFDLLGDAKDNDYLSSMSKVLDVYDLLEQLELPPTSSS
jgi:hypothetical protein